jgi:hypothetical protein
VRTANWAGIQSNFSTGYILEGDLEIRVDLKQSIADCYEPRSGSWPLEEFSVSVLAGRLARLGLATKWVSTLRLWPQHFWPRRLCCSSLGEAGEFAKRCVAPAQPARHAGRAVGGGGHPLSSRLGLKAKNTVLMALQLPDLGG